MKISIITAVYNRADTIAEALDSILAQSHEDIELIVIDGASSDGTSELLASRAAEIDVLVSEKDKGIYDALNKGLSLATGDVVALLHADDLFADNNVLARIAAEFSGDDPDGVYGDLVYVKKTDTTAIVRYWVAGQMTASSLVQGWMPPHPCLYLKRAIYQQYGMFNCAYEIAADYDFMLRVLRSGELKLTYLPFVMVKMRIGGVSNRSLGNLWKKSREDLRALRENRVGGILTLARKNFSKLPQFFGKP